MPQRAFGRTGHHVCWIGNSLHLHPSPSPALPPVLDPNSWGEAKVKAGVCCLLGGHVLPPTSDFPSLAWGRAPRTCLGWQRRVSEGWDHPAQGGLLPLTLPPGPLALSVGPVRTSLLTGCCAGPATAWGARRSPWWNVPGRPHLPDSRVSPERRQSCGLSRRAV